MIVGIIILSIIQLFCNRGYRLAHWSYVFLPSDSQMLLLSAICYEFWFLKAESLWTWLQCPLRSKMKYILYPLYRPDLPVWFLWANFRVGNKRYETLALQNIQFVKKHFKTKFQLLLDIVVYVSYTLPVSFFRNSIFNRWDSTQCIVQHLRSNERLDFDQILFSSMFFVILR